MPIYAYRCQECQQVMEVFHRSKIEPPSACRECGAEEPKRILSAVAAHVSSEPSCPAPACRCGMETGQCGAGGCAF